MSRSQVRAIVCDWPWPTEPICGDEFQSARGSDDWQQVRRQAREAGWRRVFVGRPRLSCDLCPMHAAIWHYKRGSLE